MEIEEDKTEYLEVPQEIEISEHIMNFVQYDFMTLKLCSLVCRSWSMAVRRLLLFRILVFHNKKSKTGILTHVMASTFCTIIPQVKGIWIRYIDIDALRTWKSPNLLLYSLSSTITCLRFFKCTFSNFLDLANVMKMFYCVYNVGLECVKWKALDAVGLSSGTTWSPSSLTHLRLRFTPVAPVLNGMIESTEPLRISHFETSPVNDEDVAIFCRFCHTNGKTLKFLNVFIEKRDLLLSYTIPCNISMSRGVENIDSPILNLYTSYFKMPRSLPIFSSLERLRFVSFLDSSTFNELDTGMFWATRTLSKIHPEHIFKYLTLQLVISRTGEVDQYGIRWDFFDEALGSDIFVNFQYLEFEVLGMVELDSGVSSLLSQRLPHLAARGHLRFSRSE